MSTYDDSSLFLYPSGYKASVLFAQKPMDANGQLAFTRSNDTATRVDENLLIEKVRTNLAINSAWAGVGTGVPPTSWATFDPNFSAGPSAGQIRFNTTANRGYIFQSFTVSAGDYTQSFYVDSVTTGEALSSIMSITGVTSTNVVFYEDGVVVSGATIPTAGKRYARKSTLTAGTANVRFGSGVNGAVTADWIGSRPQFEVGDIATDYIATTTAARSVGPLANIPRIDYLGGGCGKLLLEPQRTNLAPQSENFNGWSFKVNVTTTANYAVSPDGYTNADRLQFTGAGFMYGATGFIQTNGTTYTLSCYAKRNGSGTQSVGFFVNGSGVVNSAWTLTSEWQRFTYTYTASNNSSVGIAGANGADVSVYGFQFEAGAYATSYIPTLGAAVTRGADAASKTGISSLIGQTEGTLFLEWEVTQADSGVYEISLNDGTASNVVRLRQNSSNTMQLVVVSSGSIVASISSSTPIVVGQRYKLAGAYKLNDFVFYLNGNLVGSDSSGAVPLSMGSISTNRGDGNFPFYGELAQALLFKTRLPNSELASMTTL